MKKNPNTSKHVLITGATSGIGYELAKLFAQDGYNQIIVARSFTELQGTATELRGYGIKVIPIAKDLFEPKAAIELYEEVKALGININILVNNAGHGHYGEFVYTALEMELDIIQLNVVSLVTLTKLFLKDMVEKGDGKILNTSSVASKSPGPWQSVYHATKAFVQSFTEAIHVEVKDKGVTVTALLPGATDTDFFHKANMLDSKIVQDKSKLANPADVAKDGYEALMAGKDMVISGMKNKIDVAMTHISSDKMSAEKTGKQQEPINHK
ncbi:MAG TPA: SDR family oxidoreductase [Bacteroidia bacterium]|nr:SDR family oxidoreductase [Bacteroidia bacterium]